MAFRFLGRGVLALSRLRLPVCIATVRKYLQEHGSMTYGRLHSYFGRHVVYVVAVPSVQSLLKLPAKHESPDIFWNSAQGQSTPLSR